MSRSQVAELNNGMEIPVVGFGTYSPGSDTETTEQAIHLALQMGYRHFDTARIYGSEEALGNVLREAISCGMIEREDVFVTSKLWGCDHHDPVSALCQTLQNMGLEYLDSYLVHWPVKLRAGVYEPMPREEDFEELDLEATWSGMEKCLEMGLCRSIGVSNFSCSKINQLLNFASVLPAVNQVEMHPMWRQRKLREVCGEYGIHVSAYSPLGGPGNWWGSTQVVDHPIIKSIAMKHQATPAQVALQWGLTRGSSVIVKSFNPRRMQQNLRALDLTLDGSDLANINKIRERKILRGECYTNNTTSPFRSIQDLWDGEI